MSRHTARTSLVLVNLLIALMIAGAVSAQRLTPGPDETVGSRPASTPLSDQRTCNRLSDTARECIDWDRIERPTGSVTQNGSQHRDPLWNGALIGAALGTVAGIAGGFAITDCSECAGFNVPLTFGILGGGIGVGLGAAIDAMHDRRPGSSERAGRVRMSPLVAKGRRGIMAVVRF